MQLLKGSLRGVVMGHRQLEVVKGEATSVYQRMHSRGWTFAAIDRLLMVQTRLSGKFDPCQFYPQNIEGISEDFHLHGRDFFVATYEALNAPQGQHMSIVMLLHNAPHGNIVTPVLGSQKYVDNIIQEVDVENDALHVLLESGRTEILDLKTYLTEDIDEALEHPRGFELIPSRPNSFKRAVTEEERAQQVQATRARAVHELEAKKKEKLELERRNIEREQLAAEAARITETPTPQQFAAKSAPVLRLHEGQGKNSKPYIPVSSAARKRRADRNRDRTLQE